MTFQQIGDVATKLVNKWAFWQNALKGNFGPMAEGSPEHGYFRTRRKGGQWEPVAIWQDETGEWLCYRSGKEARADEEWNFCRTNPITYEAYEKAMAGNGFDDEPPVASVGHNSGSDDPFEIVSRELADEREMANAFLKTPVKDQAAADKAGIWAKRLSDLSKKADNFRVVEKEPHLTASKEVDDKWRGPVNDAKDLSNALKRHLEPFLLEQRKIENERVRKAEEEAREARRIADEASRAAAQAAYSANQETATFRDDKAADEAERLKLAALNAAQEAEKAAVFNNASAGRTGAKVSVRTEKKAKIVDFDACLMALKDREEIRSLVEPLANRAVKSGFALAGVEVMLIEKVV